VSRAGLPIARPAEEPRRAGGSPDRPPVAGFGEGAPATRGCEVIRRTLLEHLDALYRYILVRVGFDEGLAEDVLQQTAEAALRTDERVLAGIESVEAWLRGVARNHVRRHWRDASRRNGESLESVAGTDVLAFIDEGCPRRALEGREATGALLRAIAELSGEEQVLLFAFYRHGRSQAEIADELGCTSKGVEMRLYRMRARLREALAACGDES